ncbi:hypothetical protein KP509_15G026800 [Ceratopteris richardii]|uniref:Uncharacterized protein n=1 Tax=Ceratopteris richardii TaxID=49495 RepID=A0A8T2T5K1_CERRI|nr:hypothetical protein KP509_15G026800 [Ceratopteris richardii]
MLSYRAVRAKFEEGSCTDRSISFLAESMEEQDRSEGLFSEGWPNTNEASFSAPVLPSELPSPKSILLDNEERKNSISGSIRKSVRFSLQPASTILSMPITDSIQRLGTESVRQLDAELLGGGSVHMEASSVIGMNKYLLASRPPSLPECIDRSLIRRRHTEVNIVMQRENTKESFVETDNEGYNFKYYVVKKLTWTIPVLAGIMEWVYLGTCHVNLEDLPHLYDAAYRAVLTSLTWSIRCHPMPDYLNVALASPFNCQHLLKLCSVADCMELTSLKAFSEALQQSRGQQKIAILETKDLPGTRAHDFLVEGFLVLEGHPLCVLKADKSLELESPTECENGVCIEDTQKQGPVLTFERHTQSLDSISRNFASAQKKRPSKRRSPEQAWKVVLLDDDPAGSFYAFFKHASLCSLRNLIQKARTDILKKSLRKESVGPAGLFKLQMITRFKVGSILVDAIRKAFRQGLTVKEKRGSGSFIKGPSYCTSIVIKGDPCLILMAAKAIPYDMIGRSALKIRVPNAKTFSSLFHASHTFGVDLNSQSIVLVKPLYVLIKVLEFVTKLNADAYEEPSTERTFIELCTRVEPF